MMWHHFESREIYHGGYSCVCMCVIALYTHTHTQEIPVAPINSMCASLESRTEMLKMEEEDEAASIRRWFRAQFFSSHSRCNEKSVYLGISQHVITKLKASRTFGGSQQRSITPTMQLWSLEVAAGKQHHLVYIRVRAPVSVNELLQWLLHTKNNNHIIHFVGPD